MRHSKFSKTGNPSKVGFFLPLPPSLARNFRSLEPYDSAPPHVTLLQVGSVPQDRLREFLEVSGKVLRRFLSPRKATLGYVDHFQLQDGLRAYYSMVTFSAGIYELRSELYLALRDAGFSVSERHLSFRPHVTLEYSRSRTPYGRGPRGTWEFDSVEVWGLPSVRTLPLTTDTVANVVQRHLESRTFKVEERV